MAFVYILRSDLGGRYYIGSTIDIPTRLRRHNKGQHISTKAYRPWKLIYSENFELLGEARKREREIKSWKNPAYMLQVLQVR
jgi:putative endonuclease